MFVIVGLGNPGNQYEATRHNIGFMAVDFFVSETSSPIWQTKFQSEVCRTNWHGHDVLFVKPQTYMNLSGSAVQQILAFFKLTAEDLIVVFDDIDQEHGAVKTRLGGGHGGHNGIRDILAKLPDDRFYRVKLGVGKPAFKSATADWVLGRFTQEQTAQLNETVLPLAKTRLLGILKTLSKA